MRMSFADMLKFGGSRGATRPQLRQLQPLSREKREPRENEASEARRPPRPLKPQPRKESIHSSGDNSKPAYGQWNDGGAGQFSASAAKVTEEPPFQDMSAGIRHSNNGYMPCVTSRQTFSAGAQEHLSYYDKGMQRPQPNTKSITPASVSNQGQYRYQFINHLSVDHKTGLINWYACGIVFAQSKDDRDLQQFENSNTYGSDGNSAGTVCGKERPHESSASAYGISSGDTDGEGMSSFLTRPAGVGNFLYVYNNPPAGITLVSTLRAPAGCRRAVVMAGDRNKRGVLGVGRGMGLVVRKMREALPSPGF